MVLDNCIGSFDFVSCSGILLGQKGEKYCFFWHASIFMFLFLQLNLLYFSIKVSTDNFLIGANYSFQIFKEIVQDIGVAVLIDENLLKFYHFWDVSTVEVVFLKTAWPLPSRFQFESFELYKRFGLNNQFLEKLSQNFDLPKATIFGIFIDSSRTSNSWCSVTTCLISCIDVSSKSFIH